jgi:membrane associated rhomboid family serine protease
MVTIPRELYEILKARERLPVLTSSLVAFLILVFVLQQAQIIRLEDLGFSPAYALSRPWTFVTSVFLHSGFVHLGYNLLGLMYCGFYLECISQIRRRNFLFTFFLSGIVGMIAYMMIAPAGFGAVGASGAIGGLLGLLILALPYPDFFILGVLYVVGNLLLLSPQVQGAHLAGLVTGIFLGLYWRFRKSRGFT